MNNGLPPRLPHPPGFFPPQLPPHKPLAAPQGHFNLGVAAKDNRVILHFGAPVQWVGLAKKDALTLIEALQKAADACTFLEVMPEPPVAPPLPPAA